MKDLIEKTNIKKWLLFLGLSIGFLIFEIVFYFFGLDLNNITFDQAIYILLTKYFFFFILLGIIYYRYLKEKWIDFKTNFKTYLLISFKDWFSGFLFMMIANSIISKYITGLGENEAAVQTMISQKPYIALLMTTFFAPIIEELIFRKSLKDCFHNPIIYMIFSGLIFGYIHVLGSADPMEYLLIISYGSLGFFFAKTLNKTDNIYCTIMMHMIHNGILTILSMVI